MNIFFNSKLAKSIFVDYNLIINLEVLDMDLGQKLKQLRKKRGIPQDIIAEAFNVSRGTVSNWELNRRTPSIKTLEKLAQYYNVGIDYFVETKSDELTEVFHRCKNIFESPLISTEDKDLLYQDLMRLYLNTKTTDTK